MAWYSVMRVLRTMLQNYYSKNITCTKFESRSLVNHVMLLFYTPYLVVSRPSYIINVKLDPLLDIQKKF